MREPDRQMREKLVEVLAEFHIEFEDRNVSGAPALCFQLNNVTRNYPYKGGDYRANLNAAAILRRLLIQNGYSPNITVNGPPRVSPPKPEVEYSGGTPADIDVAAVFARLDRTDKGEPGIDYDTAVANFRSLQRTDPPSATGAPSSSRANIPSEASSDHSENRASAMPSPAKPVGAIGEIDSSASAAGAPDSLKVSDEGYLVYTPKLEYVPAEVMIIRLAHELIGAAGDCLIIPLHAKELASVLSYPETIARYVLKPRPQASEAPPAVVTAPPAVVTAPPAVVTPPPPVVAEVAPKLPEPVTKPPAEPVFALPVAPEPVDPLKSPRAELFGKPRFAPPVGKGAYTRGKISAPDAEIAKIPMPLARMLVALYRAQIEQGREWLPLSAAKDYLDEADNKQFSARMPWALNKGLAVRKLREDGPGYQWRLTDAGTELCMKLYVPVVGEPRTPAWVGA